MLQRLLGVEIIRLAHLAEVRVEGFLGEMGQEGHGGGQGGGERLIEAYGCLVGPEPCHVARRVPAAAEDEHGPVEGFREGDALPVRADVEVETPQAIAAEGVGAALEHDRSRVVSLDARSDDVFEQPDVALIIDAIGQRDV